MLQTIELLGVKVSRINLSLAIKTICQWVKDKQKAYVCIAPVATLVDAKRNADYRRVINGAHMVTPDGMPVVWLARIKGCPEVSRTYGPDLMRFLCAQEGIRHFFYGANEHVLQQLTHRLRIAQPKIQIAGTYAPGYTQDMRPEDPKVIQTINDSAADILWVALGSPKQDFWMAKHRAGLQVPVLIGVGAAFDFLAGTKPQAPRWMQRLGLEWLFRLVCEPKRLWRRYLLGNMLFIGYAIKEIMGKRE